MLRQCRFPRPVLFSLVHIKLFFLFYDHFFVSFLVKREEEEEENSLADRRAYYWQMDGTERWRCRRTRIVVEEDEEAPRREGSKVQGTPRRVGSLWGARGHVDSKCPIDMLQWFFSICTGRETEGQQWGVSCWNIWLGSKFKSLFVKKKRISGLSKSYNPKLNSRVLSPLLKKYLMDNQKNSPPWEMRSNRWNQNFFFCPGGGRENRCEFQIIHTNSDGHALLSRSLPPHVRARERERGGISVRAITCEPYILFALVYYWFFDYLAVTPSLTFKDRFPLLRPIHKSSYKKTPPIHKSREAIGSHSASLYVIINASFLCRAALFLPVYRFRLLLMDLSIPLNIL